MGHQVVFYMSPQDTRDVELRLRSLGPIAILHSESGTKRPRVLQSLGHEEGGQPWLFFFLARPQDVDHVNMIEVPAQGCWAVDVLCSPVIEFTRCYFDQTILRQGRVYYTDGFYNEDGLWVAKPGDFLGWAKSVRSAVRKSLMRHNAALIGNDAALWLARGGGRLVNL